MNTASEECIICGAPLDQEWDKTFALSDKVHHEKVTFKIQYGFTIAADLYIPKGNDNENSEQPALAVSGPFGAVLR